MHDLEQRKIFDWRKGEEIWVIHLLSRKFYGEKQGEKQNPKKWKTVLSPGNFNCVATLP